MIFRPGVRKSDPAHDDLDALLAAATATFGRHPDRVRSGGVVVYDDLEFVREASTDAFLLVPECDQCGSNDPASFPFEPWELLGARVKGQSVSACRNCRFRLLSSGTWAAPLRLD